MKKQPAPGVYIKSALLFAGFPVWALSTFLLGQYSAKQLEPEMVVSGTIKPHSSHVSDNADLEYLTQGQSYKLLESGSTEYMFLIDKALQKATLYKVNVEKLDEAPVSTGLFAGDKEFEGDQKTPSGFYRVVSVQDSSDWVHEGRVGDYGNFFARLDAGSWDRKGRFYAEGKSSIGLHGTNEPHLLGTRASDGCVRFETGKNNYYVNSGMLKAGTFVSILGEDDFDR
jgi:lipoprotein-anchoring transpeptidase ErfK/SrfK